VISIEQGGHILRRSVWKKFTIFQYSTTNLNLHLLMSKYFSFLDIHNSGDYDGNTRNIHYVPTITLGCPAAHELKFSDGGLRRTFLEIPTPEAKLLWVHALQYPTMEYLDKCLMEYSKEASSLFGNKCSMNQREEYANTVKRKIEISRRIDICGSQALGCAIQVVRTTIMLATIAQGLYFDILARSLKVGFMVMFESMLSTQGAEIGMIEDLEIATLWLSLVSVRLVTVQGSSSSPMTTPSKNGAVTNNDGENSPTSLTSPIPASKKHSTSDGKQVFYGKGDGLTIRRDNVSLHLCLIVLLSYFSCFCFSLDWTIYC
jgi:hypothetical protein